MFNPISAILGYLVFLLYLAVFCGKSYCKIDDDDDDGDDYNVKDVKSMRLLLILIFAVAEIFFIAFDSKLYGIRANQNNNNNNKKQPDRRLHQS